MKKILIATIFGFLTSLFVLNGAVFAQTQQAALPSAGLTPESYFYFLDRLGETLQRFFTFNPASRARLEISFAAERIAEIKVILENKGAQAKGIEVAQNLLNDDIARATTILAEQKNEGKDVSALARELDEKFSGPKTALEQAFKDQKQALENRKDELKAKIREARRLGDTAQVEALTKELGGVKAQKELLEQSEEERGKDLNAQEKSLDEQMETKDEAAKKIEEVERKKAEMMLEAPKKGLDIPAEAFAQFDDLLSQAKAAFDSGKYEEAKQLAEQAENSIENVDEKIGNLEKAKEKEEGLKEEAEDQQQEAKEKLKEADKEKSEKIKEEIKQQEENLKEEQEKVKEELQQAKEQLRGAGEER